MHQAWLLVVILKIFATTSFGQYSGNPYLDSAIDRAWQRRGGGFLTQESYAHDSAKERKLSTTIGSFGSPVVGGSGFLGHLKDQYDIQEPLPVYLPGETFVGDAERLIGVNYEPIRAIEGPLPPSYINKYRPNYERGEFVAVTKDDSKLLHKGYLERLPQDIIHEEFPIGKDRLSITTQVHKDIIHPSVQDYLTDKFQKDSFGEDHFTVKKQENIYKKVYEPKEEYIISDSVFKELPRSEQIAVKTREKIYKDVYEPEEDLIERDHLIVKTHENIFKDRMEPTKDRFFIEDRFHKNIPEKDYITYKDLHSPKVELYGKDRVVVNSQDKFYRDEYIPKESLLLDKLYKDYPGKDPVTIKTNEKIYKDMYDPSEVLVKTEEVYEPKLGSRGKDRFIIKTQEKVYKDIPEPQEKIIVEDIYRVPSKNRELYEEKFYSDDFGSYDETFYDSDELYGIKEKQFKVKIPAEESLSTFRTKSSHRNQWPKKEVIISSCDPTSGFLDSSEC